MNLPVEVIIGLRYLRASSRSRIITLSTAISIGGVTLGVAALIATLAVMTGFSEDLRNKILGTSAHVVVTDQTGLPLNDPNHVLDLVEQVPSVVAATPFVYRQGLLASASGVHGVVVRGIDPEREGQVTDLPRNLLGVEVSALQARYDDPEQPGLVRPGIFVGQELAIRLGLAVRDRVTLLSPVGPPGPFGLVPKMRRFVVAGIFASGFYEYDANLIYLSLDSAQDFFDLGGSVTGVQAKVDDVFLADRAAAEIERRLGFPYWARDWMVLNRNLFSALKLEKLVMFIILVLIILVAAFNIISSLTMIVVEKGREIAVLKAMGAASQVVMRIFLVEGLMIGLAGAVLGIPLGYGVSELLSRFYTLPPDVYYISHLPVRIKLLDVGLVATSAVLISLLATLYPSWRAARVIPSEVLRYE